MGYLVWRTLVIQNISMNQSISLYLTALGQVNWLSPEEFIFPDINAESWLLEQGSLSHRLSAHCQNLTVDLQYNHWVDVSTLTESEVELLNLEKCLLRKVILQGDGHPWVIGRTLIPESSIEGQPLDLKEQGEVPLGVTVFGADRVMRDALQVGWVDSSAGRLLARRSRLWMNGKPMLVAELFLSDSPVYSKEQVK